MFTFIFDLYAHAALHRFDRKSENFMSILIYKIGIRDKTNFILGTHRSKEHHCFVVGCLTSLRMVFQIVAQILIDQVCSCLSMYIITVQSLS